jgi:argininosuccinate lyase
MKGLPISYFKDLQEDKGLVFDGFDTIQDSLIMSCELIDNLTPNKKRMLKMANEGFTTATDFADYLVKEKKLTFRESYTISSRLVNYAEKNKKSLDQISLNELKKFYKKLDKDVLKVFDVTHSMNSKTSYGGTAANNIKKMIKKNKKELL